MTAEPISLISQNGFARTDRQLKLDVGTVDGPGLFRDMVLGRGWTPKRSPCSVRVSWAFGRPCWVQEVAQGALWNRAKSRLLGLVRVPRGAEYSPRQGV